MKKRKAVLAAVAATISGIVAFSVAGCVWFDFSSRRNKQGVSSSLGYEGNAGAWLASSVGSPRADAWEMYQDYLEKTGQTSADFSYLDFLKAINDDSASLTSALRSSVAIITEANSSYSYGSGVIYSLQGSSGEMTAYVVTNYHVAYSSKAHAIADRFYTFLYGDTYGTTSTSLKTSYVGGSMDEDVAVLKVEIPQNREDYVLALDGHDIEVRDSDYVNVGEKVYAVGNALGAGISVVSGSVSVEAEYTRMAKIDNEAESVDMLVMRVDAPANHGNSGGGLFDAQGRFLGLIDGGKEVSFGNSSVPIAGFGYALPSNRVVSVAQNIIDTLEANNSKKAYRGILGTLEVTSSRGEFNKQTQSIDIVETVELKDVDIHSPFLSDADNVVGRAITQIIVKDAEGKVVANKEIYRKHQVETLLYNLRKGYEVTLIFEEEAEKPDKISVVYSDDAHFIQVN